MRDRIRRREYVLTAHAEEEMANDDLTIYDVERGVLTGQIIERQRDAARSEWKYGVVGETVGAGEVAIVAKLGPTGKLVIITVYVP
jgi:hypothetical protein